MLKATLPQPKTVCHICSLKLRLQRSERIIYAAHYVYILQAHFLDAFVVTVHKSVHDSKRKKYSEGIDGLAQLQ